MKLSLKIMLPKRRWHYWLVAQSRAINAILVAEPDIMVCSMAALMMECWGHIPRKYWCHRFMYRWAPEHCKTCLHDETNFVFEPKDEKLAALWNERHPEARQ